MGIAEAIRDFAASGAGQAALAVLLVGIVTFALEMLAEWRDGTFRAETVALWLRTDLAGRILPVWVLLFVGYYAQGIEFGGVPLILAAGLGAAGVYVAESVATILRTWGPTSYRREVPPE